jgi:hypothetical protein
VYDESIAVLRRALDASRVGRSEKLDAFSRLDNFTRAIEHRLNPEADVEATIAHERATAASHGGRTVFDDRARPRSTARLRKGQLRLFP